MISCFSHKSRFYVDFSLIKNVFCEKQMENVGESKKSTLYKFRYLYRVLFFVDSPTHSMYAHAMGMIVFHIRDMPCISFLR